MRQLVVLAKSESHGRMTARYVVVDPSVSTKSTDVINPLKCRCSPSAGSRWTVIVCPSRSVSAMVASSLTKSTTYSNGRPSASDPFIERKVRAVEPSGVVTVTGPGAAMGPFGADMAPRTCPGATESTRDFGGVPRTCCPLFGLQCAVTGRSRSPS